MELPQIDPVRAAIAGLAEHLKPVAVERLAIGEARGRVLAVPLEADRDSPAVDVSAMDGYALRLGDVGGGPLPVQATTPAGSPPLAFLDPGKAVRIFTGAPVPAEADCVVRREDCTEFPDRVLVNVPVGTLSVGSNIRRRGENTRQGELILPAGAQIDAATVAAVASFGRSQLEVRRRVRVAILNTGDELAQAGEAVADWQIRDSNGPTLQTWLERLAWVDIVARQRVGDRLQAVCESLQAHWDQCDAILLSGGVSMGDTDYVPAAIEKLGGKILFHRLPIRPGKPVLGAALGGKLLLGLPGNPVSVAVTARVFARPLLAVLGGLQSPLAAPRVRLAAADDKRLDLTWFRLVTMDGDGQLRLTDSRGSGDVVSLARSHGFIEVPPGQSGDGPWPLTLW